MDFAVPADHRKNKLKESEKKDKHPGPRLLGNWKKKKKKTMKHEGDNYSKRDWCFWFCHQRIFKGHELVIKGRAENFQTTILLRTARILRRLLETWSD